MSYSPPVEYPPTMTPGEAAARAGEDALHCRGVRLATLTAALESFHAGAYCAAMEALTPLLRYNAHTGAAQVTGRLYARWVHTLLPETLEPLLLDWHTAMERRHDADNRRRARHLINAAIACAERLPGTSESPLLDWQKLANIIGATGSDVMPRELWPRALDLVAHIARTRLRNPNLAPSFCLGKRIQQQGRYNAMGF